MNITELNFFYPRKKSEEKITIVQGEWKTGYTPTTGSTTTRVRNENAISVEPGSTYLLTVEPSNISFPAVLAYNSNGEEWSRDIGGSMTTGTKTITIPTEYNLIGINLGIYRGTWQTITPEDVTNLTVEKVQ